MSPENHRNFSIIHQNVPECHQNFARTSNWSTLKKGITTTQASHTVAWEFAASNAREATWSRSCWARRRLRNPFRVKLCCLLMNQREVLQITVEACPAEYADMFWSHVLNKKKACCSGHLFVTHYIRRGGPSPRNPEASAKTRPQALARGMSRGRPSAPLAATRTLCAAAWPAGPKYADCPKNSPDPC